MRYVDEEKWVKSECTETEFGLWKNTKASEMYESVTLDERLANAIHAFEMGRTEAILK